MNALNFRRVKLEKLVQRNSQENSSFVVVVFDFTVAIADDDGVSKGYSLRCIQVYSEKEGLNY